MPGTRVLRTIKLDMEQMSFSVKSIVVSAGETIRFVIHNTSVISHDFTIGSSIVQHARRTVIGEMLEAEPLNPKKGNSTMFDGPGAVLLFPGETKEIVWTFTEARYLEFGCHVPGHYELGMKGKLYVRPPVDDTVAFAVADRHPVKLATFPHKHLPPVEQSESKKLQAMSLVDSETNVAAVGHSTDDQSVAPLKPLLSVSAAQLPVAEIHSQGFVHDVLKRYLEVAKARRRKLLLKHRRSLSKH